MSSGPPSIPLKYKVTATEEPPQPRRMEPAPAAAPAKPRVTHWEALFRVLIVLVIVLSVSVAYWSFAYHLAPLQKEARSKLTQVSNMSARLDQMERRWTPEQIEQTRSRYREAYAQLFTSRPALEEWLGQVKAPAEFLALDVKVVFGQSTPQGDAAQSLAIVPVSLSLEVKPQTLDTQSSLSPYERMLGFNQLLAAHGKRADLSELNVSGGTGSIQRAELVFSLWAGESAAAEAASADAPGGTPATAANNNLK